MNNIAFDELFLLHSSILVLTLLLVKIGKLSLAKFTGLYAVMVAINVVIHELVYPGEFMLGTIIAGVSGLLITVILAGLIGDGMNSSNYSSIMAFIGLAPWYLGWTASIMIFVVTIIILAGYSLTRQTWAFKSVGHPRYISMEIAKKKMKTEEFEKFLVKSNVVFALPMIAGVLISMFLLGA